jgi:outer membrane protein OmpA-like peptidoglycan-associated protein
MMNRLFFGLCLILLTWQAAGQLAPGQYTSKNKKAIRHLNEGRAAFEQKNDLQAEKSFKKALEEDDQFIEAAIGLGNLYQVTNRHAEAVAYLKKALAINPKFFHNTFYFLSQSQLMLGQYDEAKQNLEIFLKAERMNPNTRESAERLLANAAFGAHAVKNPRPFNPVNAGPGINTALNEYFPAVTADGRHFLFTRGLKVPEMPDYENEDFFISNRANGAWQTAQPMREVNSQGNEGAPTLSADGTIMFFASCANEMGDYGSSDRKGYGSCDIFYSQKMDGQWSRPRNAGSAINSAHWETQPSFSSDGRTLYFIRGIRGRDGVKEQDIYMSTISPEGKFTPAVRLSTVINTPGKEESVFIHPDNMTLYFSSDGHPGMGGLDIFMSRRQPDGQWGTPVNLGYPINSFSDENSLLVEGSGNLAFFASTDRKDGLGGLDIYQFEMPEDLKPVKITYVKGKVYNARTREPLVANFELVDLETQKTVAQSSSQHDGTFLVTLTANRNYLVNVNKEAYLFYSDNFSLKGKETDYTKPFQLDIPLEPMDTGSVVELKNVFFDVNKWDLKPESKAELDKLVQLLTKNQNLQIEISGHTDNSGDRKFNVLLSTNRAKAVYDYLITTGKIFPERLTYKGYADSRPRVPNDTPENKAKNRRTEFRVMAR